MHISTYVLLKTYLCVLVGMYKCTKCVYITGYMKSLYIHVYIHTCIYIYVYIHMIITLSRYLDMDIDIDIDTDR